jgi:mannan endo-1,4-beta-mannosidase
MAIAETTGAGASRLARPGPTGASLPWIQVAADAPYFVTEDGEPWTPIGQNDAVSWPELDGLFRRRDLAGVEAHLRYLRAHGVTVLRLMLEYAHREHRYIERPAGVFQPNMVRLWDDLFALCERVGMRILLTPFDTFFTWIRWEKHPYNRRNGGPCASREELLLCPDTRQAILARLAFATERWGGSGALFAWDLWNEMHPIHVGNRLELFHPVIAELSGFMRDLETRLHGRAHPQTVSVFGPELIWKPVLVDPILRHPDLDIANSHFYEEGTIDDPRDTVAPAVSVGRLVRQALADTTEGRPFFDSESGPIHTFKDRHKTLPEPFDDEYFRHMQWAHFASGGAGGGMRWPNRDPHVLTHGMRVAQRGLAGFLPLIDWPRFRRRNLNGELRVSLPSVEPFGCGDGAQAVVWLLRRDTIGADGRLRRDAAPIRPVITIPGLAPGRYLATAWDTESGAAVASWEADANADGLTLKPSLVTDVAIAVRRAREPGG